MLNQLLYVLSNLDKFTKYFKEMLVLFWYDTYLWIDIINPQYKFKLSMDFYYVSLPAVGGHVIPKVVESRTIWA